MTSTSAEAGAEVFQEQNVDDEWTYDESWAAAWLGFLFIVSIVENTLLLLVFYKRRCMRTLSNRLVASLVVANLALTLVVMPLILLDMLRWTVMPEVTCHCLNGLIFMMAATSVTCSLSIHVDRYLAVLDPLHYCHRITRPKANAMIAATWLFSALLSVLDTFVAPVEWDWNVCSADGAVPAQRVSWTIQGAYVIFILFALFVAPFVAQTWIYWRIYIAAKSNSKRTWQSCATLSPSSSIPSTPLSLSEALQGECPLVARGYPAQGRPQLPLLRQNSFAQFVMHRWSNAGHQSPTSTGPFKEEGRTAAFSLAIMLTSLVCWTPFFLHFLLEWLWSGTSLWFHRLSIFSLLAFSAISPMLYGFHSHRARRELAQLFRRRPSFRLDSIQKVPPQRKFGVQHKWQVTKLEWRSDTSEPVSVSVIPGRALPKDALEAENGAESPERTQRVSVTSAVRHWGRGSVSSGSSHTSDFSSISALTNLADW